MAKDPNLGLIVARPGGEVWRFGGWEAGRYIRVASLSKIVTAGVAQTAGIGSADPMTQLLGWRLEHPEAPGTPVTAGMVAAHHSGLSDRLGLNPAAGETLSRMCQRPERWQAAPGACLSYCNFGYLLLAAAAETVTGRRFGDLAQDWLRDRGIPGGFNFWGMTREERSRTQAALRPGPDGKLEPRVDGEIAEEGLVGPDGRTIEAPDPGVAPWLWSPQGGLRTTLEGALTLAGATAAMEARPLWKAGQGPALGPARVYQSWGFGLQLLDHPPHWPRPLMGHFADAYGVRAGAWRDAVTGTHFAYILNGVEEVTGPDADDFDTREIDLFQIVAAEAA